MSTDPFDEIRLDESFLEGAPHEGSADERIAAAERIARANNRLRASGEIADGSGKPGPRRRRSLPWIAIGAAIAAAIVILAIVAR